MIRLAALALAALVAAAPNAAFAQDKLRVVTTSADLKSLAEAVGGERIEAESLAAPEQDPHSIELKPAQLARLRRADVLLRIGLDHEPWLVRTLQASKATVVDLSKSVRLLQTETPRLRAERRAHVHAFGNTHYWLDPHNARPITEAILNALAALRPADKSTFEANRADFLSRLDAKVAEWDAALRPYRGTKVVVVHDSWAYFAERFGLKIVAAAEPHPGVPPSPSELSALFTRMREAGVRLLIADPHANPALVRQISERSGAKAVTLSPSGDDYLKLFDENVKRLAAALKND
ncbi:MAG: manganese/iron transport system substrate-binding protein [Variibacter sp.]|nr:manganese/iron transport system substrate-binding protein [Variibacter sp.]